MVKETGYNTIEYYENGTEDQNSNLKQLKEVTLLMTLIWIHWKHTSKQTREH
eukprot:SAG11_NODE_41661_length_191_cov_17.739130_1_plen_51_part_10